MCGRYTLDMHKQRVMGLFGLDELLDDLPPRYNIAPGQRVPAIGLKPGGTKRGLAMLNWGFVPKWASDPKSGPKPINARAETLLDKPTFREPFLQRRCILPASGFFEWKAAGRKKVAHLIRLTNDSPMAFAGLWEVWGRGADKLAPCCIITVAANEKLKELHDRMPAILPPAAYDDWLNRDTPSEKAYAWLKTYPAGEMEIVPVGPAVNSVANDSPECIAPAA